MKEFEASKRAIRREVATLITQEIDKSFERLVIETPQWTGTVAASWRISVTYGSGYTQMPSRTREQALQKGHMVAVGTAMSDVLGWQIPVINSYPYKTIWLYNNAPNTAYAEDSTNVRPINQPAGQYGKFVKNITYMNVVLNKEIIV